MTPVRDRSPENVILLHPERRRWTTLNLPNQRIKMLPREIGTLTNLRSLDLSGNEISILPPQIGNLAYLSSLDISHNQLTAVPPEVGRLSNLYTLNLSCNNLTSLPPELGKLRKLEKLDLHGNGSFVSPPPEIIAQGTKAIMAYLNGQLQKTRRQWVSKLLLVGEGGVGKTSLLRALRGKAFEAELPTTHGIEVTSLELPHPSNPDVKMLLNAWDFGGQEIYHATHQFFLTNRSLFLLAWNARHGFEQGKLYYWLDTIKARAPESPVLIVATHIDERDADLPFADLRRKYPKIIQQLNVSNKTMKGFPALSKGLITAAASLPLMGETWPANWLDAAQAVKCRPENVITPMLLRRVFTRHKVTADEISVLARWLHELGDILYFREDPELNDTVILKPQWATEYVSKVLESDEVIGDLGIFTREHMEELWSDLDRSKQDHFLRLMERFDLSYRTLENKDISLVVERLPLDPPNYQREWNAIKNKSGCHEIKMRFKLDTALPAGVPTWFIARSHRFTTRTHWRFGALFTDNAQGRHLGLIEAFPHDRYLQLSVRGPQPHNFFALLRDGLEVTLARFPGLGIERRIPCLGHFGKPCAHEFDYDHLQKAIERQPPVNELQCPIGFENVSVPVLIFGLDWRTQDDVLKAIQALDARAERRHSERQVQHLEMLALLQREFMRLWRREQSFDESHCPNVFVFRPLGARRWPASLAGEKLVLQLYCQAPGCWHPTKDGGKYSIEKPAKWIELVGPYVTRLVKVLQHTVPLVGPWMGLSFPEYEKLLKNDLALMNEFVKKLPQGEESRGSDFAERVQPDRIEGAAFRGFRKLLTALDPNEDWGGLRKVLTPEGHYLWLCDFHAAEYK